MNEECIKWDNLLKTTMTRLKLNEERPDIMRDTEKLTAAASPLAEGSQSSIVKVQEIAKDASILRVRLPGGLR